MNKHRFLEVQKAVSLCLKLYSYKQKSRFGCGSHNLKYY